MDANTPSTASALIRLFDLSLSSMTTDDLKWFSRLNAFAQDESGNVETLAEFLAIISTTHGDALDYLTQKLPALLWHISYQTAVINALHAIADDADYMLSTTDNKKPA